MIPQRSLLEYKEMLLKDLKMSVGLNKSQQKKLRQIDNTSPEMQDFLGCLSRDEQHTFIKNMSDDVVKIFHYETNCAYNPEYTIQ